MNDPNKVIDVNLSCLFSLKAELLKKQHEVKLAKASKPTPSEFKSKESSKLKSRKQDTEVSRTDEATVYESEDYVQMEKSRRVLEAKSKFYDQMSRSGGSLNTDDNCLVMFNRKKQEEEELKPTKQQSRERLNSSSSSDSSKAEGDEEDEVEYVDCLGRTRKCLRKDVKEAKRRDKQLAESMPERLDQTKANWMINVHINSSEGNNDFEVNKPSFRIPAPPESVYSEALSTMTKHDEQRINWERKEQENFEKPDVHYQDVFFDEARTHGVGYYAFSTDEKERREQQRELEKARETTANEQNRREEIRAKRDSLVADRVLAAKNRIRARNGLPPISKEELAKLKEISTEKEELKMEDCPKQFERDQKGEAEEAEREKLRKEHIRDWDRDKRGCKDQKPITKNDQDGKNDVAWQYKAERLPMSQEEWNEKQRSLRPQEFAPLIEPNPKRTNFTSLPPPLPTSLDSEFTNFHSTKREKQMQRRNYLAATANDNEPSSSGNSHEGAAISSSTDFDFSPSTSGNSQGGATIPSPDDLDLGPSTSKRSKTEDDLERSIEAGLKFLRKYCDVGAMGKKETWAAKADY